MRSKGIPVVTNDHPAMLPANSSIKSSYIDLAAHLLLQTPSRLKDHHSSAFDQACSPYYKIIGVMKQNQSLFRPFPGEIPCTMPHDLLSAKSSCQCSRCGLIREGMVAEISLDLDLERLRRNNHAGMAVCDQVVFLNQFQKNENNLPRFRFLDTVVLEQGEALYALYFQDGRARIAKDLSIKSWVLARKEQLDLRYQIKKYERDHPNFHFAAFQHQSQKRIKEFQNNIRYKMPPVLNKMAILKLRGQAEEKLVSKSQFQDLFSATKSRSYDLKDIEYIQVFPVMHGEEDSSYLRTIKYFRNQEYLKRSFKLAECYALTWKQRNDSLEKLQERVFEEISLATKQPISQDMKLEYMTYKLLIYFQEISNMRIEEAIVHYITNDQGATVYFKKIECIRFEKRVPVADIGIDLPTKKEIAPEDHINLRDEMKKLFGGFQQQFSRLDRQRELMQEKVRKDREYSNYVFKTVTQRNGDNLHKVLQSNNQRYKKDQLGL